MMSRYRGLTAILVLFAATLPAMGQEPAVREFLADYVKAFNKQDLDAVSGMWAEKCVHVDRETGQRTEGRAAIRADLAEIFKKESKTLLAGKVDRVRMIKPDVASAEGTVTTTVGDDEPIVSTYAAILVKQGDKWQIDSVEEMPVPQPETATDALADLAWMEGTWMDDSKDAPIVSTIRWSSNRTFLIRTFSSKDGDKVTQLGTQIIGWDPRSRQIRSWTFNTDGSFGDGIWSKAGDDWIIKSTQTLADGRAASGTHVLTQVNQNKVTLGLIGHEIDGEPMPASTPVTVVRIAEPETPADKDADTPKK